MLRITEGFEQEWAWAALERCLLTTVFSKALTQYAHNALYFSTQSLEQEWAVLSITVMIITVFSITFAQYAHKLKFHIEVRSSGMSYAERYCAHSSQHWIWVLLIWAMSMLSKSSYFKSITTCSTTIHRVTHINGFGFARDRSSYVFASSEMQIHIYFFPFFFATYIL